MTPPGGSAKNPAKNFDLEIKISIINDFEAGF